MRPKIVIVTNNILEHTEIKSLFVKEGFEVVLFSDINTNTIELISNLTPSVILIEFDVDGHDGIDICYQLKMEKKTEAFVVINSTQPEDYIQIEAFKAGADDYILKSVSKRVLLKKINALVRRSRLTTLFHQHALISHKDLVIDRESYTVLKGSAKLSLPKKEFELLYLMFKNPKKIFSRTEIYHAIWENVENYNPRIIDVHIRKIREKIGDSYITTIKGVGYQLTKT